MDENREFVCFTDVKGHSQFVPEFAVAAEDSYLSSVTFTQGIRACDQEEEQQIMEVASVSVPMQKEVQVAMAPLAFLVPPVLKSATAVRVGQAVLRTLSVAGSGCVVGVSIGLTEDNPQLSGIYNAIYGQAVFGAAFGTVVDMWYALPKAPNLSQILHGMGVGSVSALVCGNTSYVMEPSRQFINDIMRRIFNWMN